MNWSSLGEFAHMGGYGLDVWGSLGMCAAAIAAECWALSARRRRLRELPLDETDDLDPRPIHES